MTSDRNNRVNVEIERKFLLSARPDRQAEHLYKIRQGYIAREGGNVVRIRQKDDRYILSVKTPAGGMGRFEIEMEINEEEGEVLLAACAGTLIEKIRRTYTIGDHIWEVDVFDGENKGLMVAEVELSSEDEKVPLPHWIGPEVTRYDKFYNATLSQNPFKNWGVTYENLVARMGG